MSHSKFAGLALTMVALAAPARAGLWTDGDPGVDHMYNDITNFNMSTNTTTECFNACVAASSCRGWVFIPSGACGAVPVCYLKTSFGPPTLNPCRVSGIIPATILSKPFNALPHGRAAASGWLQTELQLQAQGLTGHLALFWPDVMNSTWIGGNADGGLHERTPYWLNAMAPLVAHVGALEPNVSAQLDTYVNAILEGQAPSGWLGPDDMATSGDQYWSRFNVLQTLLAYWELTSDPRIIPAMVRFSAEMRRRMPGTPLGDWSVVRAQDLILVLETMIDAFPRLNVPAGIGPAFLYDFALEVHAQMLANGGDWKTWYDTPQFPTNVTCVPNMPCNLLTHGVNNGQAIKSEAVWYRISQDVTDIASTYTRVYKLDVYHGVPSGVFQADEHLAGNMPSHATELCAVVEAMFSYEIAGEVIGDAFFFERAEQIGYNALPGAWTKDFWAHDYLHQTNQINAAHDDPHVWVTDGPDSTILGLQPNYGCCTANGHQGFVKLAQRIVYTTPAGGIAVAIWGPVNANATLTSGQTATVSVVTDYPFGDNATVVVNAPAGTPLQLRVPSWATQATISVNGGAPISIGSNNGSFYTVTLPTASATVLVNFAPDIRVEAWYNGALAVRRGALLYGLSMGENFTTLASYAFESKDYQVLPTTPWNYALLVADVTNPGASLTFQQVSRPGPIPFDATAPPVIITGQARILNGWTEAQNAAGVPPASPVDCSSAGACGPLVPVTLYPFGNTHLRIAEIPYVTA